MAKPPEIDYAIYRLRSSVEMIRSIPEEARKHLAEIRKEQDELTDLIIMLETK